MQDNELLFTQIEYLLERARGIVKREAGEPLDHTAINAQAKDYAAREEGIAKLLVSQFSLQHGELDDSPTGYSVDKQNLGEDTIVTVFNLQGYQTGVIGVESIRFFYLSKKPPTSCPTAFFCYGERVGVDTQIYLYISKHMDELTLPEVEVLLKSRQILPASLDTIYVFDKEGNYGKISVFPKSVLDRRPDLWNHPSLKYVASKITTADFELIDKALSVVEGKIKQF